MPPALIPRHHVSINIHPRPGPNATGGQRMRLGRLRPAIRGPVAERPVRLARRRGVADG